MKTSNLLVRTNIDFAHYIDVLTHISDTLLAAGWVKQSYLQALLAREESYPTGIVLEQHAVAIPHCEAEHALQPAIYLIRPDRPVLFQQADDDGMVAAELIIALVVTNPAEQLILLRTLFSQLQDPDFLNQLLTSSDSELIYLMNQRLFNQ